MRYAAQQNGLARIETIAVGVSIALIVVLTMAPASWRRGRTTLGD